MAFILRKVDEGETFADIGRALGISRERVRQIAKRAGVVSRHRGNDNPAQRRRTDAKYAEAYKRWMAADGTPVGHGTGLVPSGLYPWAKNRGLPTPNRPPIGHGTAGRYAKGCRCDACRDWLAGQARAYVESRTGRKVQVRGPSRYVRRGVVPHGTACGYSYHRCRCDLCREAMRVHNKTQRSRRQST